MAYFEGTWGRIQGEEWCITPVGGGGVTHIRRAVQQLPREGALEAVTETISELEIHKMVAFRSHFRTRSHFFS